MPDDSRGSRVAPLLLLSRPEVRDELKIPAAQVDEVNRAIADLHHQAATLKGKTGEAAVLARKAVDEGQAAWLEAHLTPDQVDRLWQIDLSWEGPAAMTTRPKVAEALALSDEQKAALATALRERNARKARPKDIPAANHQFGERVLSILDDGQKLRWTKMVGHPIILKTASTPPEPAAR